jgi:hypothetical protein
MISDDLSLSLPQGMIRTLYVQMLGERYWYPHGENY